MFGRILIPLVLLGRQLLVGCFGYGEMIWCLEKTFLFSYVGGMFGYPLTLYMGYPPEAYFTDFGRCGITTIAGNGHNVFLPDTWVAISLRTDNN